MKDRRSNRWHAMQVDDVLRAFGTNRYTGLSSRESAVRRLKNGNNTLWSAESSGQQPSLAHQLLDYTTVLFAIAVCLAALFSHGAEAVAILLLLLFSVCLRAATLLSTRKIFQHYAKFQCPRCRVMRDGKSRYVFSEQLAPGDILLFSAGDTVPCDVRLISGNLRVSEAYFSKDRRCIEKDAGEVLPEKVVWSQRKNILYAASTVLGGSGVGVAVATGERTYAFAQGGHISVPKCSEMAVLRRISDWSHRISFWMMVVCGIYLLAGVFAKKSAVPIDQLFISSIALIVASISEFLSVTMLAAFAGAARRLDVHHSCIAKSPAAIENLGNVEWVVFGSERLLQTGRLTVHSFCDERIQYHLYDSNTELPAALLSLYRNTGRCLPKQSALSDRSASGGSCEISEILSALDVERYLNSHNSQYVCIESTVCNGLQTSLVAENNAVFAYICGDASDVIRCCSRVVDDNGPRPITAEEIASVYAYSRDCRMHARQTIAVARRISPFHHMENPISVQNSMTFLGCFAVENPIDDSIVHLTEQCRKGGIRMTVLCDDLCSGKYVASQAGIFTESDRACRANDPDLAVFLSSDETGNLVMQANNTEKIRMVRELRMHSSRVVYVGDGLADLPCVQMTPSVVVEQDNGEVLDVLSRRAEVLISPPSAQSSKKYASGASRVLQAVAVSRSAVLNLRGMALYLLLTQSLRVVLALFSVFTDMPLLSSAQLLLLGCILDFLAVLVIAFRYPSKDVLSVDGRRTALPAWNTGTLAAAGIGVLSGLLLSLALLLMDRFSLLFDPEAVDAIRLIGAIAVSFVAAHVCAEGAAASTHRRFGVSTMHFVYVAVTCLLVIWMAYMGVTRCHITDWRVWIGCGLPAMITGVMLCVYKKTQ